MDCDPNRHELLAPTPHTGEAGAALARQTNRHKGGDHGVFEVSKDRVHVALGGIEPQNRVAHQLPGSMPCGVSAALDLHHGDVAGEQDVRPRGAASPQRNDRVMLNEQQGVLTRIALTRRKKGLLLRQRADIVEATEVNDANWGHCHGTRRYHGIGWVGRWLQAPMKIPRILLVLATLLLAVAWTAHPAAASGQHGVYHLKNGLTLPYPLDNVFRGFADCRRGRHKHPALDIGGVGPNWGLGTPVRAIARSRVIFIGRPEDNPKRFGQRITKAKTVYRGKKTLPTSATVKGYGKVHFFTSTYGSSRTGEMVVTKVLEGRLKGYKVTYMHLGAHHPDLKVGSDLAGGQELGVMGGTAVLESAPHLHLSIKRPSGRPVDVGPLFSIGPTRASCRRGKKGELRLRKAYSKKAQKVMFGLRRADRRHFVSPKELPKCGEWSHADHFKSGSYLDHRYLLPKGATDPAKPWEIRVTRTAGKWRPRIKVETPQGAVLYSGSQAKKSLVRKYRFKRLANGRRGNRAEIHMRPRKSRDLTVRVGRWSAKKRPPRNAAYRIEIKRPCKD
ncbi:MAG: hypothetical protein ACI9MR_003129 [Myxococcota bacterium]|jgi:hypothetical protein